MRADGKKLKHFDPTYTVAAHIMKRRSDALNMITIDLPCEPMHNYINQARKEGRRVGHLALILAAYARTVATHPELNRFVVNKRLYARNELRVGMVVLRKGESDGAMSKMDLSPSDTLDEINEKLRAYVESNSAATESNSTENMVGTLLKIPGLLSIGVPLLMWLDKHGWLPKSVIDISPFHASMSITDLASIKTNHIYHHCYDFGTTSVFLAMGTPHEVPVRKKGEIEFERCIPVGIVMDERICPGHQFAEAFQEFRRYLADPTLLEQRPETVLCDPAL